MTTGRALHRALAWPTLAATIGWLVYEWAAVDKGYLYFAESPSRFLILLMITGVGAVILLGYERLPAGQKRQVAFCLVGGLALGTTAFALRLAWSVAQLADFLRETGSLWYGMPAVLCPCGMAVYLWWAAYRLWKAKPA